MASTAVNAVLKLKSKVSDNSCDVYIHVHVCKHAFVWTICGKSCISRCLHAVRIDTCTMHIIAYVCTRVVFDGGPIPTLVFFQTPYCLAFSSYIYKFVLSEGVFRDYSLAMILKLHMCSMCVFLKSANYCQRVIYGFCFRQRFNEAVSESNSSFQ